MDILYQAICTSLQTFFILFVLTFPYRKNFVCHKAIVFAAIGVFSCLPIIPYYLIGADFHEFGYIRILFSCAAMIFLSMIVAYLSRIRFAVAVFAVYVLRNLTDSLQMLSRFIDIFLLPDTLTGSGVIILLYFYFLLLLLPLLLYYISHNVKTELNFTVPDTWKLLWAVPFIYYIFFCIFADVDYLKTIYTWTFHLIALPFVWFFGTLISYYVILKMIAESAQAAALREQLKYSELVRKFQVRESESLQNNINTTINMRHDMKHHIIVLLGYLNTPDIESAKHYMNDLANSLDSLQLQSFCQNHAVNSLINHYYERAVKCRIKADISAHIPETFPVSSTDLCAILGNLFENALEACMRSDIFDSFISLRIDRAGSNMLVISIRNSFSDKIRTSNGNFLSSKREEDGIGTASVKYMVDKYDGICRFTYDNNIFEVSILLKGCPV